jgi:serine/threonine protein kinase
LRIGGFRWIVHAMSASPETIVGAELRGVFAPPAGVVRAAQTTVVYKLVRFVGAGKFAWVYEAHAIQPKGAATRQAPERVAVKLLYREDVQGTRRFQREIKVMRQLPAHPNCVAYKGHGTHDKRMWVAMDFIDGFTLAAVLRSQKAIPERAACLLMTQLCDGFEGLHRLGLTHRDITPDNIMITQADRQVKLMDFGLVLDSQGLLQLYEQVDILDGQDFKDDLDAGLIAGTPEFMAPEQILDPHEKDRARQKTDTTADVFALGTIFFQLLSGQQLFPYEKGARGATGKQALINYLEYRVKQRDDDVVCPQSVNAELWTIVKKSLAREPKVRQRDATELGADIRYYLETGQGVLEDDLSATIATEFDANRIKSIALPMSTSEFASLTKAAEEAKAVVARAQAQAQAAAPAGEHQVASARQAPSSPSPASSASAEGPVAPAGGLASVTSATPTIPNGVMSPLDAVNPAFPDAPLGPKKPASGKTPYGGPGSEKPTRVEGDAPEPAAQPVPEQAPPKGRRWIFAAVGVGFVGLGVLLAVLLR